MSFFIIKNDLFAQGHQNCSRTQYCHIVKFILPLETISLPKAIENAHDHNIVTIIVDFLKISCLVVTFFIIGNNLFAQGDQNCSRSQYCHNYGGLFLSLKTISLPRAIENAHGHATAADDATLWRVYYINFPEPSVACCGSV